VRVEPDAQRVEWLVEVDALPEAQAKFDALVVQQIYRLVGDVPGAREPPMSSTAATVAVGGLRDQADLREPDMSEQRQARLPVPDSVCGAGSRPVLIPACWLPEPA
jgi:hypothetical protein